MTRTARMMPLLAAALLLAGCSANDANQSSDAGSTDQSVEEACAVFDENNAALGQMIETSNPADAAASAALMDEIVETMKAEDKITNPEVKGPWDEMIASIEGITNLSNELQEGTPSEEQTQKLVDLQQKGNDAAAKLQSLCAPEAAQS